MNKPLPIISINHNINKHKQQAKENLQSDEGIIHRKNNIMIQNLFGEKLKAIINLKNLCYEEQKMLM